MRWDQAFATRFFAKEQKELKQMALSLVRFFF
jgi:hypothetical protein